MADDEEKPGPRSPAEGIPDAPAGGPPPSDAAGELDAGQAVGPTPPMDFWEALYGRRSIRRFDPRPVPRELVEQVMHAGIWAPSSCNYQMWDLVAVDEPEVNARLAGLSLQMANAPVNIVVSYGRDFSEEAYANIQSASALIQNMSLAAHVLGLGTFWITQMGDAEKVRETVGLPYDRLVIAVLALGYPKHAQKQGPKRRPLNQVSHWNHYAGEPIPSSADPERWTPELLALYQRARVLNGLRHNKPRAWERRALEAMLARLVPPGPGADKGRWLDVLPCTGILTEHLARARPGYAFDVAERTPEVAAFAARRTRPHAGACAWPAPRPGFPAPAEATYDVVTCLFRLEGLRAADRKKLLSDLQRWLKPGGSLILGCVSRRSFHDLSERLRARRGGPRGVEYVLSPDPNVGPFESLAPGEVERLAREAGLRVLERLALQAAPQPEEVAFRTRNFGRASRRVARGLARAMQVAERAPGIEARYGRFRFWKLGRA
jgi:nitroreductase/SAM-dependent methyltransferase